MVETGGYSALPRGVCKPGSLNRPIEGYVPQNSRSNAFCEHLPSLRPVVNGQPSLGHPQPHRTRRIQEPLRVLAAAASQFSLMPTSHLAPTS